MYIKKDESMENIENNQSQEKEIDLIGLVKKLWAIRLKIILFAFVGGVIGIIVAYSIPREYSAVVRLAPEMGNGTDKVGGMAGMAALAGIDLSSSKGVDGINVAIYPDIVSSIPFQMEFADLQVKTADGKNVYRFYDYLTDEAKGPWWSYVIQLPGKAVGGIISLIKGGKSEAVGDSIDLKKPTPKQEAYFMVMRRRATASLDKKNGIISVTASMQDPVISSVIADSLVSKLQRYITTYKTNKARQDLIFRTKLLAEAQTKYFKADTLLAQVLDKNRNVISQAYKVNIERLQNERDLAYNIYNQAAQQVEQAKIQVQDNTPVVTVIEPSKVPLKADSPKKMMILIAFGFLGALIPCGILLFKEFFPVEAKKTEDPDPE